MTLSVTHPNGQAMSFEDALVSGLLYPRASSSMRGTSVSRDIPVAREQGYHMRAASVPPGGTLPQKQNQVFSYKQSSHQSSGGQFPTQQQQHQMQQHQQQQQHRGGSLSHQRAAGLSGSMSGMINGGAHLKPGVGTLPHSMSGTQQRRVWEKQHHVQQHQTGGTAAATTPVTSSSFHNDQPAQSQSPLLNGNAHFVNGKLFASRPGYQIEGNGNVINLMSGETISLNQAQRMNIVQQIPDDDYDAGTLPPTNSMFNRVSPSANLLQ